VSLLKKTELKFINTIDDWHKPQLKCIYYQNLQDKIDNTKRESRKWEDSYLDMY